MQRETKLVYMTIIALSWIGVSLLLVLRFGLPGNMITWCCAAVVNVTFVVCIRLLQYLLSRSMMVVCFLMLLYCAFPECSADVRYFKHYYLFDTTRGRLGVEIAPGLIFSRKGQNTHLVEGYLGSCNPEWIRAQIMSPSAKDGNERVNSANIIGSSQLLGILDKLPSAEARRQVLSCSADRANLLRVHQWLLLVCLVSFDYPEGFDAESWWKTHKCVFDRVHDAETAALMVQGWSDSVSTILRRNKMTKVSHNTDEVALYLQVACYQENSGWGGDHAFSKAFHEVKEHIDNDRPIPELRCPPIVWWPTLFPPKPRK